MANINSLSEAVTYLKNEFVNEIDNHTQFENPEVSQLADIITEIFSNLEKEVNGYND